MVDMPKDTRRSVASRPLPGASPGSTSTSAAPRLQRAGLLALSLALLASCARPDFSRPLPAKAAVRSAEFRAGLGAALTNPFIEGNRFTTLSNGDEIFPAMLRSIRSARQTVNMEMFVFEKGDVPEQFATALADKAREGVEVRLLLDAVGAGKSRRYHDELRNAGVALEIYHSVWWHDFRRYNHRTHRKLLIVDGKVAFTGGVGLADHWKGDARGPEEWRELHYRVEGPIVAQLQGAFMDNWGHTRNEILQGSAHFPPLTAQGPASAQVMVSAPRRQRYNAELCYHLAIASARQSIRIINPYFLPDRTLVEALSAAAQRGVAVQIIMPGEHIDQKAVRRGSRKRWPALLRAGVALYEYEPTMIHTKLLIVDDYFVSVGSTNLDPRSLRINDEANLNVLDAAFAREQVRHFDRDLQQATAVKNEFDLNRVKDVPFETLQTPVESQL